MKRGDPEAAIGAALLRAIVPDPDAAPALLEEELQERRSKELLVEVEPEARRPAIPPRAMAHHAPLGRRDGHGPAIDLEVLRWGRPVPVANHNHLVDRKDC